MQTLFIQRMLRRCERRSSIFNHSRGNIKKEFGKYLIGYVSDGAPVINGNNNFFHSRLHNSYPNIWYLYCIAHAIHLTSSHASKHIH